MDSNNKPIGNPYTESMLVDVVMDIACEVLGCDKSGLTPDTSLGDELGAESLDFVEIRYNIERRLGVSLPQRSVFEHLAAQAPDMAAIANNGKVTELGASALRGSPFAYSEQLAREGVRPSEVMQGGTIRNWAHLCLAILDRLPEACPDCGHREAIISRSGKPACGSCGAILKPATGDEVMSAATAEWLLEQEQTAVAA